MKEGFRQSMAWLHTWAGLLVGWVLFFVYLTGTLGYVQYEITRWMEPEKPMVSEVPSTQDLLPHALDILSTRAPNGAHWFVNFPGGRRGTTLRIAWETRAVEGREGLEDFFSEDYDPTTGALITGIRKTDGGRRLYQMHYNLSYMSRDLAIRLVGICTMFMFVAMISGIIVHKKIFRDLFTFRPGRGQRSWLDGHNVLAVTSLPFHLMITYTGLVFFALTYMPIGPAVLYGDNGADKFSADVFEYDDPDPSLSKHVAEMADLPLMMADASQRWGGTVAPISFDIENPGRVISRVTIRPPEDYAISSFVGVLVFDGVTGEMVNDFGAGMSNAADTHDVLTGLHEGVFAGALLRVLYFLSGLAGTAMIGTGLILWSVKRKAKLAQKQKPPLGIEIVDRLNLGTLIGLPIAIAAYFWANRLVPVGIENRADIEVNVMFVVWAVMFIHPVWRPLHTAWVEQLYIASAAFALLPIVNFLTTDRHLGITIPHGDWVLAGFDLTALVVALAFGLVARHMQGKGKTTRLFRPFSRVKTDGVP